MAVHSGLHKPEFRSKGAVPSCLAIHELVDRGRRAVPSSQGIHNAGDRNRRGTPSSLGFHSPEDRSRREKSRAAASSSSACRQSHHRPFPTASGEMDRSQFGAFLGRAFRNLVAFSVDGSIHFICMDRAETARMAICP